MDSLAERKENYFWPLEMAYKIFFVEALKEDAPVSYCLTTR